MKNRPWQEKVLLEFDATRGLYEDFARTLAALAERILSVSGIQVHSVTWRCKERSSLARKLDQTNKSYSALTDITDVAAMRITTYFSDDVDRVAEVVKGEFQIDEANSIDKRATLDPDRFGYQSLHYVALLSKARSALVEHAKFNGLKIEIQIRSILQHAWAEIEHDLGYKSARGVPRDVRRRFARVAGLLELADAEFGSIRQQLTEYAKSVVSEIQLDPANVELDLLSLRALFTFESNVSALDSIVATAMARPLQQDPTDVNEDYVARLAKLGILRVDELEAVAAREREALGRFADYWAALPSELPDRPEPVEPVGAGIGLFYLLYLLIWRTRDRGVALDYFESNKIGFNPNKAQFVEDLLAFTG